MVENRTSTGDGCRFSYDLAAGLTTVEHYDGQTRRHYWNAQNLIVRYVDERGENWRYEWDDNELLTRRIDPLGNAVTFVYDEMGNRVQETDADGNTRTTTWLEHRALPAAIIEADGSATRFWYDEHHGLKRVVDPMGQTTQLRRDEFGQVVEEVDAAGNSRYQSTTRPGRLFVRRTVPGVLPATAITLWAGWWPRLAPTVKRRATATTPQGVRCSSIVRKAGRSRLNGTNAACR